jgi:sugar lactone lactonase YvrE
LELDPGKNEGEFGYLVGIAVDTRGMVFISDSHNYRVSVFTTEGQYVTSLGKHGEGPGEFNKPRKLAVDNCGVLAVCDILNNRVHIILIIS